MPKVALQSDTNYINKTRLRELQLLELEILKNINDICNENGITYFLAEKTMLGAVRHKGFIPWATNLKVAMPRQDYNKFSKIALKKLNEKFKYLSEDSCIDYPFAFAKVVSLDTHDFKNTSSPLSDEFCGPCVDILPIDPYDTQDIKILKAKNKKIKALCKKLACSKGAANTKLHKKINEILTACNQNAPFVSTFSETLAPKKQVVTKQAYGKPRFVEFEDGVFPIPEKAEAILTKLYGDFMSLPSIYYRVAKSPYHDPISMATIDQTKPLEEDELDREALTQIRQLQLYGLEILKDVDRVCRENNITYYLGEGTLLGAIRHKGFIPWDDDIDIVMPREDLERFMEICDKELDPGYKFQFYHNIKNYWVQSPKVRMLRKTEFEQPKLLKFTDDIGPYIDIFALDYAPKINKSLERQEKYIKTYRRILFIKTGFSKPRNFLQKIYKQYARFFTARQIHEKIYKKATKNNHKPHNYICNFGSYYSIHKEAFPIETFGTPKYVPFEDAMFPVPSDYEFVLTRTYGNYMQLPPKEKRRAHHSFK